MDLVSTSPLVKDLTNLLITKGLTNLLDKDSINLQTTLMDNKDLTANSPILICPLQEIKALINLVLTSSLHKDLISLPDKDLTNLLVKDLTSLLDKGLINLLAKDLTNHLDRDLANLLDKALVNLLDKDSDSLDSLIKDQNNLIDLPE